MSIRPHIPLAILAVLLVSSSLLADELPLGTTISGETDSDHPARYEFSASDPGVLSIVVRADNDVSISVFESSGQLLAGGNIDIDYQSDVGAEQGLFVLGQPGDFAIEVSPLGSPAKFQIGASWLPMSQVEVPEDPQGKPETAADLPLDENVFGKIDTVVGDHLDWYRFTAEKAGRLTVATRARSGDLVLLCFAENSYNEEIEYSDQDLENDLGREQITINVEEGEVLYFLVRSYGSDADYAIRAALKE